MDGLSVDMTTMVDIRDQANKELAMRLVTDIQSGDTFFTDLNGFQMQPRRHFLKLPLQANFYPMPTQAFIQDGQHRLSLHTAQALGASSLDNGQGPHRPPPHPTAARTYSLSPGEAVEGREERTWFLSWGLVVG